MIKKCKYYRDMMKKRSNKDFLMAKKDVGFVIVIILIMILKKEITDIS